MVFARFNKVGLSPVRLTHPVQLGQKLTYPFLQLRFLDLDTFSAVIDCASARSK